jgi:hypothetical protein
VIRLKIGILTFHEANNFGAVLQAYALKETIKQFNNGSVEIIDYKQPYIFEDYLLVKINGSSAQEFIRSLVDNIRLLPFKYLYKKNFKKFRKKYLDISVVKYHNPKDINGYDIYIVGSDQVWNTRIVKYDEVFFLGFGTGKKKKIAYGASIGSDNVSVEQRAWIEKGINNIDYISVREDSAVKIITPLVNKQVERVLDPTLLADPKLWNKCINDTKLKTPYLLLYKVPVNDELYNVTNIIARQLHLPVVYVHYHSYSNFDDSDKPKKYGFKNKKTGGPSEFITLIKNAKFIVTNSFHGTAFSIIFNKNFVAVPGAGGTRITGLLNMLHLSDRVVTNHNQVTENFNFEMNYKTANEILSKEKEKSLNFLKNALEN